MGTMAGMFSFPDLEKGKKVLESAFGRRIGAALWPVVVFVVVVAGLLAGIMLTATSAEKLHSMWREHTLTWSSPVHIAQQCLPDLVQKWKENKDPNDPADQRVGQALLKLLREGVVIAKGTRREFDKAGWSEKDATPAVMTPGQWLGLQFIEFNNFSVAVRGSNTADQFVGFDMAIAKPCR
jgi:hypothetical protein